MSKGLVGEFYMECEQDVKKGLMTHMGVVHRMVTDVCDEYFGKMRRQVSQQCPQGTLLMYDLMRTTQANLNKPVSDREAVLLTAVFRQGCYVFGLKALFDCCFPSLCSLP